jgi:hypothetical protein
MGTTARTTNSTTDRQGTSPGRRRASARAREDEIARDEYDLLTAALLGALVGAGMTMLFRRGPRGHRPIGPVMRATGRGLRTAGVAGMSGARWLGDRGEELWDRVPREDIANRVQGYLETAREAIDDAVSNEVKDLRKAIRRRRRKLGL